MGTADVQSAANKLAAKLQELRIPYAICGGLAVFEHGHERMTTDVDVLLTADGLERFRREALGRGWLERFPGSRGVKDIEHRVPIDVLVAGATAGRSGQSPVRFPDPADVAIDRHGRQYVDLRTLVEMKLASGLDTPDRLQDLADVIALIRRNRLGLAFSEQLHPAVESKFRELWQHAQLEDGTP